MTEKVVLTREEKEEYESLIKLLIYDKPIKNRVYEVIKDIKQQTCKETAEKIFQEINHLIIKDKTTPIWIKEKLIELAKQHSTEIKE